MDGDFKMVFFTGILLFIEEMDFIFILFDIKLSVMLLVFYTKGGEC